MKQIIQVILVCSAMVAAASLAILAVDPLVQRWEEKTASEQAEAERQNHLAHKTYCSSVLNEVREGLTLVLGGEKDAKCREFILNALARDAASDRTRALFEKASARRAEELRQIGCILNTNADPDVTLCSPSDP